MKLFSTLAFLALSALLLVPVTAAQALDVQLSLAFAPNGSVTWDEVALVGEPGAPELGRVEKPRRVLRQAKEIDGFAILVEVANRHHSARIPK